VKTAWTDYERDRRQWLREQREEELARRRERLLDLLLALLGVLAVVLVLT
jgi:hypothetical protein